MSQSSSHRPGGDVYVQDASLKDIAPLSTGAFNARLCELFSSALKGASGDIGMQIYVDPTHPAEALGHVECQLKMLTCLLSQGGQSGFDLDDESLTGMCELLRACSGAVAEVSEMMQHVSGPGAR